VIGWLLLLAIKKHLNPNFNDGQTGLGTGIIANSNSEPLAYRYTLGE
jgi:hypothetical protein